MSGMFQDHVNAMYILKQERLQEGAVTKPLSDEILRILIMAYVGIRSKDFTEEEWQASYSIICYFISVMLETLI